MMEHEEGVRFGIITVSDRCFAGLAQDTSGPNLEDLVKKSVSYTTILRKTIPDDLATIRDTLLEMVETCDVILTSGGTGFAPRDVTPEATKLVIDREAAGLSIAMMTSSLAITKMAMLSRGICGIKNQTLIVNLPGSKKSSEECFEAIAMAIPHAVALMRSRVREVETVHKELQGNTSQHQHVNRHHHHCHHHQQNLDSKVDVSMVARRERTSPYPCIAVSKASSLVAAHSAVLGIETVFYREALGRVLAQEVFAADPLPPFPASIKDGYAVIASDGAGSRQVMGDSHAGLKPGDQRTLVAGACVRINTGAPVPPGADAVVQVEDTRVLRESDDGRTELEVEIMSVPTVGQDIRPVGSDIYAGQLVLRKGCLLGSSDLGLLATVGCTEVLVYRRPIVAVLSTGNELQDPSLPLKPGCIRDSNKTTLLALLKENGCATVDIGIAMDDPKAMVAKVHEALTAGDIVVTTGSASMGDKDILKQIITTDLGAVIHFGRVLMKPGKPTTFATCEYDGKKKLIFCLPGNPVSATVTCHLFVLPSIRQMSGHLKCKATAVTAVMAEEVNLDPRPEYQRGVLSWPPGCPLPTATVTGDQISSRLLSFASANCLLEFPPRDESNLKLAKGAHVSALLLAHI